MIAHPHRAKGHIWLSHRAEPGSARDFRSAQSQHPGSRAPVRGNDGNNSLGTLFAWNMPRFLRTYLNEPAEEVLRVPHFGR